MPDTATTKTEHIMQVMRDKLASRALNAGDRLPSIRQLATAMNVSPSTIVEAYDRLVAEGLVRARRGAGFYVSDTKLPPLNIADMGNERPRDIDPFWVSRQSLDAREGMLQPGCGWLPEDWMPQDALRKGLRQLARADDAILTNYANAHGSQKLRRYLLGRFAEEHLPVSLEQIMLTGSASQALDLICRMLLRPGDAVLVDDPGYFNFHALLRAHQLRVIGVPRKMDGPDLDAFAAALRDAAPRLYVTNSALHNPTGMALSPQIAHRLLSLTADHDVTIVEDDTFADLEPEPSPRLAVLDGLSRVLRIGGFSKTLSASVRCGYIAGRQDWIEKLVDLQVATSFGGPSPVATELLSSVLIGGGYRRHLSELHTRLAAARKRETKKLAQLNIRPWSDPRGGFYLWCEFPDDIDTGEIARRCVTDGVVLAPGNVFSPSRSAIRFMRFNVAQMNNPKVYVALEKAMT
ncbi:PLP-dependent aminotransferase family protein [Qingshengfaniella alkalisoli]|uniref:PLP-dependent aminotransferase family protein n=1 Tax=Qingshengfaniella alkalisoli TaxID=2599296 RepID=A0A5B8IAS2_9RHOB|nr:PLP-dependent aminotransferase family protein [Qingshengfaniella alkalisoli]QDY71129.1 PLP-dependent aminotransferase family protein [Qingshengfaniella alkalisoli]